MVFSGMLFPHVPVDLDTCPHDPPGEALNHPYRLDAQLRVSRAELPIPLERLLVMN